MKRLLSIILAIIYIFSFALLCFAHSGRTDANGGHYDRSTGEYHYHNGDSFSPYYSNDSESTTKKSFDEIMSERNETTTNPDLFSHDITLGYYEDEIHSSGSARIEKEEETTSHTETTMVDNSVKEETSTSLWEEIKLIASEVWSFILAICTSFCFSLFLFGIIFPILTLPYTAITKKEVSEDLLSKILIIGSIVGTFVFLFIFIE